MFYQHKWEGRPFRRRVAKVTLTSTGNLHGLSAGANHPQSPQTLHPASKTIRQNPSVQALFGEYFLKELLTGCHPFTCGVPMGMPLTSLGNAYGDAVPVFKEFPWGCHSFPWGASMGLPFILRKDSPWRCRPLFQYDLSKEMMASPE